MNKEKFLYRLKAMLSTLSAEECADILYDYEEHFRAGLEAGKTEEEISRELGDPEELAMTFTERCEAAPPGPRSVPKASKPLLIFSLFFLDVCIALPVGCSLVSLWAALLGLALGLVALSSGLLVNFLPNSFPYMPDLARIFMGISMAGLTVLTAIGLWFCVKSSCRMFVRYVRWHKKIIQGGDRV